MRRDVHHREMPQVPSKNEMAVPLCSRPYQEVGEARCVPAPAREIGQASGETRGGHVHIEDASAIQV